MANKIQIKKYLENKKNEAIAKLRKESEQLQEEAKNRFFDTYKNDIEVIRAEIIRISSMYDNLLEKIRKLGIGESKSHYSTPECLFNDLCSRLTISNLRKYYIEVSEATKIKEQYEKKIEDTEKEYNNLIAVCSVNTAKDCMGTLENLGFNTSEIEVKKEECTTLITNIDASKLFV